MSMNYEVRGAKWHRGHEGEPVLQCSLYRDGAKVALYGGDEHGGEPRWEWLDRGSRAEVKGVEFGGKAYSCEGTVEEALLAARCAAVPSARDEELGMEVWKTPDLFVEELASKAEFAAKLARACRTKTCFRLVGDEEGSYRSVNLAWGGKAKEWLDAKYGAKLEKVLNEGI